VVWGQAPVAALEVGGKVVMQNASGSGVFWIQCERIFRIIGYFLRGRLLAVRACIF
jgi:hypothetical protein